MKKLLISILFVSLLLVALMIGVSAAEYVYKGTDTNSITYVNVNLNSKLLENRSTGFMQFNNTSNNGSFYGFCVNVSMNVTPNQNKYTETSSGVALAGVSNAAVKANNIEMLINYAMFNDPYMNPGLSQPIPNYYYNIGTAQNIQLSIWKIIHGNDFSISTLAPYLEMSADRTQTKFMEEFFAKLNNGGILAYYNKRLTLANATAKITGSLTEKNKSGDYITYGPFEVKVTNDLLNNELFKLSFTNGAGLEFVDANNNVITEIKPNTPFYVKVNIKKASCSISFKAELKNYIYAYSIKFLTGIDTCTKKAVQPAVICKPFYSCYSASFCGKIEGKSIGESAWSGCATSNSFPHDKKAVSHDKSIARTGSGWGMAVKYDHNTMGKTCEYDVIAGQYYTCGKITITHDSVKKTLTVDFVPYVGYKIGEIHCGVYNKPTDVPNGPGQYLKNSKLTGTISGNTITFKNYSGGEIWIVAHADV